MLRNVQFIKIVHLILDQPLYKTNDFIDGYIQNQPISNST